MFILKHIISQREKMLYMEYFNSRSASGVSGANSKASAAASVGVSDMSDVSGVSGANSKEKTVWSEVDSYDATIDSELIYKKSQQRKFIYLDNPDLLNNELSGSVYRYDFQTE
jgi:hypothetical protein